MAKCKYCDAPLKWKKPYTAGDRPVELSGKEHDCPKFKGKGGYAKNEKWIVLKADDYEFCNMCARFCYKESTFEKYPMIKYVSLEEHIKLYHPNDEILDDIDFMVASDEEKERIRVKWGVPKRTKKYMLIDRRLH